MRCFPVIMRYSIIVMRFRRYNYEIQSSFIHLFIFNLMGLVKFVNRSSYSPFKSNFQEANVNPDRYDEPQCVKNETLMSLLVMTSDWFLCAAPLAVYPCTLCFDWLLSLILLMHFNSVSLEGSGKISSCLSPHLSRHFLLFFFFVFSLSFLFAYSDFFVRNVWFCFVRQFLTFCELKRNWKIRNDV